MSKIIVLILVFCSVFCLESKADTIDYYIVKFNGKIIEENDSGERVLRLDINQISRNDSIEVGFYGCAPCFNCVRIAYLSEYSNNNDEEKGIGYGFKEVLLGAHNFTPPKISLGILNMKADYTREFGVYYYEVGLKARRHKVLVLKIIVEGKRIED